MSRVPSGYEIYSDLKAVEKVAIILYKYLLNLIAFLSLTGYETFKKLFYSFELKFCVCV